MSDDRAINVSVSLYQSQVDKVKAYVKNHKLKSEAALFQQILNDFFQKQRKQNTRDFFVYIGIPIMFFILSYYVFLNLQKLEDILFLKDLYFYELSIMKNIFFVITLGTVSGIGTSMYLLYHKKKAQTG